MEFIVRRKGENYTLTFLGLEEEASSYLLTKDIVMSCFLGVLEKALNRMPDNSELKVNIYFTVPKD